MITLNILNKWLVEESENEHFEFKSAQHQFNTDKLMKYCVALANEGGGYLVLVINYHAELLILKHS